MYKTLDKIWQGIYHHVMRELKTSKLLNGKTVLVTGATSGIGLSLAKKAAALGAYVIGVGRAKSKIDIALEELQDINPKSKVTYLLADLSSLRAVSGLAAEVKDQLKEWNAKKLDRLVLNAATVPFWQELTPDGYDKQWVVNYFSGFLLVHELADVLRNAGCARIISVSSGSHYHTRLRWDDLQLFRKYNPLLVYKQTKLAQVIFTAEFNRRQAGRTDMHAFAADPGLVKTDIGMKGKSRLMDFFWKLRRKGGIAPESAAERILFLLSENGIQQSENIYWKYGKPVAPNPFALEESCGKRLWEISEKLCGVKA